MLRVKKTQRFIQSLLCRLVLRIRRSYFIHHPDYLVASLRFRLLIQLFQQVHNAQIDSVQADKGLTCLKAYSPVRVRKNGAQGFDCQSVFTFP